MKKFKGKLQDHYEYGFFVWLRQIVEPIQMFIGNVLCNLNIHNYKSFPDFCYRCMEKNPIYDNAQTRKVLFEKTQKPRRRRRVAKR